MNSASRNRARAARSSSLVPALLPLVAALYASSAFSQAAAPDDAKAQQDAAVQLETVTVTATRRREPLRDVPLRVETVQIGPLERSGAGSIADYVGALPGVNVSTDGGPGRSQVSIRGVNIGASGTPTVGTYIDEVAFGSSTSFIGEATAALDMSLLDLHHIEVLRGPQGTLYGAGAMGGLVKYVTNEPDSFGLSGKAGLAVRGIRGGALGHTENAVVNVPLSEGVAAVRVAVFNDHDGGFSKAIGPVTGDHVNDGNTRGGRVSLLMEPMNKLKLRLTGTQQEIKRNGTAIVDYDIHTGQVVSGDLTHKLFAAEPYHVKTGVVSADLEYDFGWARLNVIGSSQRFDAHNILDATDILVDAVGGHAVADYVTLDNTAWLRKQSQEVRLTSARGTFEWIVGAYHNKEHGSRNQSFMIKMVGDDALVPLQPDRQPSTYEENALYGDVTFNPTTALSFTVGARVARNKQTYDVFVEGVSAYGALGSKDKSDTYLATARYSIDKNNSVYVRAASGYRPGGPNPPAYDENGQVIPNTPRTFDPDTLWSYEGGYKADLLDKRLSLEVALFDIRWKDIQQPVPVGVGTLLGNASKAEIKGLELAARYAIGKDWNLDGSLAWTDAKLKEDAPELGPAGSRLPNTAKLSVSLGARYTYTLAGRPAFSSLSLRRVGQRDAGFDHEGTAVPNFSLPAYTQADAQWGMDFGDWQVAAFVRNLTDKRGLLGGNTALTAFGNGLPLRTTVTQPRTWGASLTYNF